MGAGLLATVLPKLRRDRELRLTTVAARCARYAWELATSRLYLLGADRVGRHARTLGRPRVVNLGRLEIGSHVLLRSVNVPVELATGPAGTLRIGSGVRLNYGTSIAAESSVTLGDRVRVGPYVMIVDTDFHELNRRGRRPQARPVVIEDDVWIGAKASVLKGVRVGRGSVIGVGSVVTRDVEPFSIMAGVPARRVGTIDPDEFEPETIA